MLELIRAGHVNGLRIDHPDGLLDPAGYLRMLQEAYRALWQGEGIDGDDDSGSAGRRRTPLRFTWWSRRS